MNLSIGLSLTRPSGPLGFNPASLFASGEVGAWYDPSDSTTVFQDAAGTTPAGVGDPVGLILDKSQGLTLGSELVTNGTFDTDISGWVNYGPGGGGNPTWDSGRLKIDALTEFDGATANVVVESGKRYKISADIELGSAASAKIEIIGKAILAASSSGSFSSIFLADTTSYTIYAVSGAGSTGTAWFDNISVKELPGNHATQSTSAARPVLQQSGGLYYLDFDGVDDCLIHTFAHAGDTSTIAAAERSGGNTMQGLFFCTPSSTKLTGGVWALSVNPNWGSYEHGTTWMDTGESLLNTPAVIANISVDSPSSQSLYTNGTLSLAGTGAFYAGDGKERLVVGRETDLGRYFNGNLFGVISIDRAITSGELADVNAYLATKSGVTL